MHSSTLRGTRGIAVAVITGVVGLLGAVPAADAELKVGPNHRLTADPSAFRGKDQVSIAVNPSNPKHIVAINVNYLSESCDASASFDGGQTWSTAASLQPPAAGMGSPFMATCRVSDHAGESIFDGVQFGTGNNVYATSITPRALAGVEEGASTLVYKSTDGGVTWGQGVVAMPGGTGGTRYTGPYYELPSIVVDPGAGTNEADILYSVARDASGSGNSDLTPLPNPPTTPNGGPFDPCPGGVSGTTTTRCDAVRVARSDNGGQTWSAPVQASGAGVPTIDAASPVLLADHSIALTYRTAGPPTGATPSPADIRYVRSTNQGQNWSAETIVTGVTNLARSSSMRTQPLAATASSFPRMAVSKTNGNVYMVYNQGPPGPTEPAGGYQGSDHFIPPDSHVYFQRSTNNGATWSRPKLINDNKIHPGTQIVQTRHPDVSVAPNGRVDIVWEDRRHWYHGPGERVCLHTHAVCDDARLGDTYYAYSTDNGGTFSKDRRISDQSHNNDVGYDYRFATYWAFGPQVVPMGNDELLVAWMDSREGSFNTDNQDIYLANVNHAASSTIPQAKIDQSDPIAMSVAASKLGYKGGGEAALVSNFAVRNATRVVIVNKDDPAAALAASVLARANLSPVLLSSSGGLSDSVKAEIARLNPAGAWIVGDSGSLSAQVADDVASAAGIAAGTVTRITGTGNAGLAAAIAAAMDKRTQVEKDASAPAFDAAVIANPAGPDAAAAVGLAAARRLPLLYVDSSDTVPAATEAALSSLAINRTLVIGDTSQVSSTVRSAMPSSTRLGGTDQYGTSRAVADEAVQRGLPTNVVYVTDGTKPLDAALIGAVVGRATGIHLLAPAPLHSSAASAVSAATLTRVDRLVVAGSTVTPAGTPPPPPPPVAPPPVAPAPVAPAPKGSTPPPPPPGAPALSRKGKLSSKVTPSRDTKAPFRFRTSGTLTLPAGVTKLAGCKGSVRIDIKRATKRISRRTVKLSRSCSYSSRTTFRSRKTLGSSKRLTIRARFLGNTAVNAVNATTRFARVRR